MKKILPILLFFAGTAYHQEVQAQNRPSKPLVDNPTYLEGKNDMLIAATDFGNISRYENAVIDESMPISRRGELLVKPDLEAMGAEDSSPYRCRLFVYRNPL